MSLKNTTTPKDEWKTIDRVPLKLTTTKFHISEYDKAFEFARNKRSYVGEAIDKEDKFCGWYVPA